MDPDLLVFTLLPAGVLLAGAGWCLVGPVKPIADLPYRWGTWRGIFYAVLAVALYVGAFIGGYRALKIRGEPLPVLLGLGIVGILVGLVGAGLLFRRKYGVVLLFLVEGTVGLLAILPAVAKDDHLSSTVGQVLGTVIYLWANASYFAKRWRFMADPSQRAVDHESTRSSNTLAQKASTFSGFAVGKEDLLARYAALSDDQLKVMQRGELTEIAMNCLDDELRRRGLEATG